MNILVIGEKCTDKFTYGKAFRLCPDYPAPVFTPGREVIDDGMAGNVVNNLKSLGINPDFFHNNEELIKQRYVDELTNHTFLRVDNTDRVANLDASKLMLGRSLTNYDCIVISDYCKGFLTESIIEYICRLHDNVIIETKKILGDYCKKAKFIKMNEKEYEDIKPHINIDEWKEKLIVTLGDKGCMYNDKIYPVDKVEVFDLCGAGDTWLATFVYGILSFEGDIDEAITMANSAALQVVQRRGVVAVYSRQYLNGEHEIVKKLKC